MDTYRSSEARSQLGHRNEKPNRRPPISSESERRRVMVTVHAVENDFEIFRDNWLKDARDDYIDEWLEFIRAVGQQFGAKKIHDYEQFIGYLEQLKQDPNVNYTPEFSDVDHLCERARIFDGVVKNSRNKLQGTFYNHLDKYCLSFSSEADDYDVTSVLEYENNINVWRQDIQDGLAEMDKYLNQIRDLSPTFPDYVTDYNKILHFMGLVYDTIPKICEPMKDWVMWDANYPRKVQDEINSLNKRKVEIVEDIRRHQMRVDDFKHKVTRKNYQVVKLQRQVEDAVDEKRYFRRRELSIKDASDKIEADMERKRRDLDEVNYRINRRKFTSHNEKDNLYAMSEVLRDEIRQLEKRHNTLATQAISVQKDKYNAQKELHKLQGDYQDQYKLGKNVHDTMGSKLIDVHGLQEEHKDLIGKIAALKKIREVKLHSDTVKKIYHYGYKAGRKVEMHGKSTCPMMIRLHPSAHFFNYLLVNGAWISG